MVAVASTFVGARPLDKATRYDRAERRNTEVDQPRIIHVYNKGIEGVG